MALVRIGGRVARDVQLPSGPIVCQPGAVIDLLDADLDALQAAMPCTRLDTPAVPGGPIVPVPPSLPESPAAPLPPSEPPPDKTSGGGPAAKLKFKIKPADES